MCYETDHGGIHILSLPNSLSALECSCLNALLRNHTGQEVHWWHTQQDIGFYMWPAGVLSWLGVTGMSLAFRRTRRGLRQLQPVIDRFKYAAESRLAEKASLQRHPGESTAELAELDRKSVV